MEAALAQIQEWPGLARSPQLAKFLDYIVRARLDGNEANIKAYSIAVDVFGRPPSFDPQSDPIVRVQARRLRALLDEYYAIHGESGRVRFSLPVGRYVPEFTDGASDAATDVRAEEAGEAQAGGQRRRGRWWRAGDVLLVAVIGIAAVGVTVGLLGVLQPRPARSAVPDRPSVAVAEFASVGTAPAAPVSVAGLAVELVTDLGLFPDIAATYLQRLENGNAAQSLTAYEVTGVARSEGGNVHVTASLRKTGSDVLLWTRTVTVPADALQENLDDISRSFADHLGSSLGPLHADALRWLADHQNLAGSESGYICWLLFSHYRDTASAETGERARSCAAGLEAREPDAPIALAMRGALLLDATVRSQPPGGLDPEPLQQAERLLKRALVLAPTSSPVWLEYGLFLGTVGRRGEAEAALTSALQLNPANLDALAAYGRLLSERGESPRGNATAQDALARAQLAPYWYHEAPAVNALRAGEDAEAIAQAESLVAGDAELASVIAAVAAHRSGAEDVLNRYIGQLLEVTRFRRFGILPVLRQRLSDPELVTDIATVLAEAGIELSALEGPY